MAEFGQLICPRHQVIDSGFRVFGEVLRQESQQVADVFFRIQAVGLCRFHDGIGRRASLHLVGREA